MNVGDEADDHDRDRERDDQLDEREPAAGARSLTHHLAGVARAESREPRDRAVRCRHGHVDANRVRARRPARRGPRADLYRVLAEARRWRCHWRRARRCRRSCSRARRRSSAGRPRPGRPRIAYAFDSASSRYALAIDAACVARHRARAAYRDRGKQAQHRCRPRSRSRRWRSTSSTSVAPRCATRVVHRSRHCTVTAPVAGIHAHGERADVQRCNWIDESAGGRNSMTAAPPQRPQASRWSGVCDQATAPPRPSALAGLHCPVG